MVWFVVIYPLLQGYAPLAQLVEHQTFNLGVMGSSPVWRTRGSSE